MTNRRTITVDGNQAATSLAHRTNEVIAIYPITPASWLEYARLMEQAGADALELNFYYVATDLLEISEEIEDRLLEVVSSVKKSVSIPVALKLSPFWSSLPHLAHRLDQQRIDGLVLFNRSTSRCSRCSGA